MAERTFVVNAPLDQARVAVLNVFTSEGWTVSPFSGDTIQISRGKKGMSIAFGALMGDTFYLSQNLQFGTGPNSPRSCSPRGSSWACSNLRPHENLFLTHRHFLHR